jgi:hypothetical protein
MRPPAVSNGWRRALWGLLPATVGAAAVAVGGHDAFLPSASLTTVLTGTVMLLAGGVALVGAAALFAKPQLVRTHDRPWASDRPWARVVFAAFVCSTLITLYVLSSALRSVDRNALVVPICALLLLASAAGAVAFGRSFTPGIRALGASVLGLAGTVFAAWQLWYTSEYMPSRAAASVELTAQVDVLEADGERATARVTLTTRNRSSSDLIVVGAPYTLLGTTLEPETAAPDSRRAARAFNGILRDPQATRFSRDTTERSTELLAAGKFVGDRETLRAGGVETRHYVVTYPSSCFDALRLRAEVFGVGDLDLTLTEPPVVRRTAGDYVYIFWYVDPGSWLKAAVDGPYRWVVIRYEIPDVAALNPPDFIRATARVPSPSWSSDPPTLREAEDLFAEPVGDTQRLSEVYANDEVPAAAADLEAVNPREPSGRAGGGAPGRRGCPSRRSSLR